VDGFSVFGGFERGSGRTFLVPVPTWDSQTLLSVIQNWIRPGTTIMSDCWRAYDCLSSEGFVHQTVNHSQISSIPRLVLILKTVVGFLSPYMFCS